MILKLEGDHAVAKQIKNCCHSRNPVWDIPTAGADTDLHALAHGAGVEGRHCHLSSSQIP